LVRSRVRRVRKSCSSLDLSENPLPDPGSWEEIADPERRLRVALTELCDYFRRREGLWTNILRDQEIPHLKDNSDVREIMRPIIEHWERMQRTLAAGWESSAGSPSLRLAPLKSARLRSASLRSAPPRAASPR
jgi:hypothetical protein